MYVLQNTETGQFVAPAGSKRSYTANPLDAQRFHLDTAQKHKCGNERIVKLQDLIDASMVGPVL